MKTAPVILGIALALSVTVAAGNLLPRPPHRERSEPGRASGSEGVWSACPEPGFVQSLKRHGFKATSYPAEAHDRAKRAAHVIYIADVAPLVSAEDKPVAPKVHVKPWRNLPRRR